MNFLQFRIYDDDIPVYDDDVPVLCYIEEQ